MRRTIIICLVILTLFFSLGLFFYPSMDEKMATHWDAQGQVNGYMSRFWGTFFMPFLALGIFLVFLSVPIIDPLKKNIFKFRRQYESFIAILLAFLLYIYILTLMWNLYYPMNLLRMMLPAFGILFFYVGVLMKNTEQNWFIGIRNPWTMSSKNVWKRTHDLGSILFKICGVIAIFSVALERHALFLIIGPIVLCSIIITVYSYLLYRKEKRKRS